MRKARFLIGGGIVLLVALAMAWRRDDANFSTDTLVSLIAVGMMMALTGHIVIDRLQESPGGTLRDVLLWGTLIALVALAYTKRAMFGF